MLAAFTKLKNAENVKRFIISKKIINFDYLPIRELDSIFFPITKRTGIPNAKVIDTKLKFKKKVQAITIEDFLRNKLTKKQLSLIPRAQEIVGKIMILEIPDQLKSEEKLIAEAYLKLNKNVETVVKKQEIHSGTFRTRKVRIIAGKKTKETVHYENGVKIKLHLEKTYFSARSANERLRIAKLIKSGESVLVMFSGVAPFPLVFARNSDAKEIYGIELNPLAHQYALENVTLNDFGDKIKIFQGDVRTILLTIKKKFDRIAMPLPKTGDEFLNITLPKVKKGGTIHLYAFLNEAGIDSYAKKVRELCKSLKYSVKIIRKVKCGQFSPGTFRVCYDIKIK